MSFLTRFIRLFKRSESFPLTVIFTEEPGMGFIAHFDQFPETYSQGNDKKEALHNLTMTLKAVLELEIDEFKKNSVKENSEKSRRESVIVEMAI